MSARSNPADSSGAQSEKNRAPQNKATDAVRREGRRRGNRKGNNGKTRRTPQQLERQERVYLLNVVKGMTIRAIAAELGICANTVVADIKCEADRRAAELAERRETERAASVAFYDDIAARALKKSDQYDTLVDQALANPELAARVTDRALDAALQARTRRDKILGLDAPTKVDIGIQSLLDALEGDDDPSKPLAGSDGPAPNDEEAP